MIDEAWYGTICSNLVMVKLAENEGGANIRPQLSRNKTQKIERKRPFSKKCRVVAKLADDNSIKNLVCHINRVNT